MIIMMLSTSHPIYAFTHIYSSMNASTGRSSVCNMVLDYRTVSTIHAKITYEVCDTDDDSDDDGDNDKMD